ncbi:MAG: MATE family efflux transporter [Ardenticatenaceae bacterium]
MSSKPSNKNNPPEISPEIRSKAQNDKEKPVPPHEAVSDSRSLRRRVLDLAWPVIGENLLQTLLMVIDTLLVARLGAEALAGVGGALQILFFVIAVLSALSVGSAVLVAQAFGARDFRRASQLARQSLVWSVIFSLPLALGGFFLSEYIIAMFGLEPEVAQIAVEYLEVTMATSVVMVGLYIGGGVLRGADDSRTPMLVTALANVVNVFLSYGMIFGAFGMPELGAVGSAWASFLSRAIGLSLLLFVLWRGQNGLSIKVTKMEGARNWFPQPKIAKQVLNIGLPAALEQVLISTAFVVLTIVVADLGTLMLAAHRIVLNALSLSFLPGLGFGIAATTLVGQSIGAKRPEDALAATRIATNWALLWMGTLALIIFLLAPQIMSLFTTDPTVVNIGSVGLRVVAFAQPFWAIFFVQAGGLRGLGNTQFPLRVNGSGMWIAVGLAYLFIQTISPGLGSVWGGFLITAPATAIILWWRFRREIAERPQ